jgi:hypothetical protein
MRTDIISRIETCLAERDRLEREILVVNARVQTYEDVLSMLPADALERPVPPSTGAADSDGRGRRALSTQWKSALLFLKKSSYSIFTIDNLLEAVSSTSGTEIPRGNVRSQMAAYVTRGVIERVGQGHFRLTPAGEAQLGLLNADKDAPDADDAIRHNTSLGHNSIPAAVADFVTQPETQTIEEMLE